MSLTRYPLIIAFSTIVELGVIGISSIARTVWLAAGGSKVADSSAARGSAPTPPTCSKRLRNVVEEMASLRRARAAGVCARTRGRYQRLCGWLQPRERRDHRHPGRAREPEPRRAARRHRARVQPRPERRHADQHAADRPAVRAHGHRDDRAHDPALRPAQQRQPQGRRCNCGDLRGGARRARARLDRPLLRPPDPGGGVAQPRVACGRLGRAVHARPERPSQRTREDQGARSRLAVLGRRRAEVAHLLFAEGIRGPSRRIRRSSSAFASSTRLSRPSSRPHGAG